MIVLVWRGPALCIDLLMQHSLCLKWEFASDLNQLSSGQKQPQTIWLKGTFFVMCIKNTAEYADEKNGKGAELVQSVMIFSWISFWATPNSAEMHLIWFPQELMQNQNCWEGFQILHERALWWISKHVFILDQTVSTRSICMQFVNKLPTTWSAQVKSLDFIKTAKWTLLLRSESVLRIQNCKVCNMSAWTHVKLAVQ